MNTTSSASTDLIRKELSKQGHSFLRIPERIISLTKILDASWEEFIAQPIHVKQKHSFVNGVGYEYRGSTELDYKETFHITRKYELHNSATTVDRYYVETAQDFIEETSDFAFGLIGSLFESYGYNKAYLQSSPSCTHLLRSIHYFPRTMDQVMQEKSIAAASHVDKGVTIHWFQTNDGLQILWEGEWRMIVHPDDVVMFYMGLLGQLYSNCDFIAVCHRAIVTPQTEVLGRRVHVSFIDFGGWFYDKNKWDSAQTRFPAGENYLMNKKKFTKYFSQGEVKVH